MPEADTKEHECSHRDEQCQHGQRLYVGRGVDQEFEIALAMGVGPSPFIW